MTSLLLPLSAYHAPFFLEVPGGFGGPTILRDAVPPGTPSPARTAHESFTAHPPNPSLPPNLQFSDNDHTSAAQYPRDATSTFLWANGLSLGEEPNPAPFTPGVQMEEDNEEYYADPGAPPPLSQLEGARKNNRGDPKKVPPGGHFLRKLSLMLNDEAMDKYIRSNKIDGMNAFTIPNIEAFVANALSEYFPDMNQWGSFQKQLSNYGYKKKDRDKESGIWILRNKVPSRALRRPKNPPSRSTGQELRPVTPTASSAILHPEDQPNLYARVDKLENELKAARSELKTTRELLSEAETQLRAMMNMVHEMSIRMGALFTGNSSSHPAAPSGPVAGTVGDVFQGKRAGSSGGTHYEPSSKRLSNTPIIQTSQDNSSRSGMEPTVNTIDPALLQWPPNQQPPSFASFPSPAHTLPPASSQQISGGGFPQDNLFYSRVENDPYPMGLDHFRQQPTATPPTGRPNPASTTAAAFAGQAPVPPRNSFSPGPSSGRLLYGGAQPVPPPQPRGSSWFWNRSASRVDQS